MAIVNYVRHTHTHTNEIFCFSSYIKYTRDARLILIFDTTSPGPHTASHPHSEPTTDRQSSYDNIAYRKSTKQRESKILTILFWRQDTGRTEYCVIKINTQSNSWYDFTPLQPRVTLGTILRDKHPELLLASFYVTFRERIWLLFSGSLHYTWRDFTRLRNWVIVAGLTHAKWLYRDVNMPSYMAAFYATWKWPFIAGLTHA